LRQRGRQFCLRGISFKATRQLFGSEKPRSRNYIDGTDIQDELLYLFEPFRMITLGNGGPLLDLGELLRQCKTSIILTKTGVGAPLRAATPRFIAFEPLLVNTRSCRQHENSPVRRIDQESRGRVVKTVYMTVSHNEFFRLNEKRGSLLALSRQYLK
jgi:hypothetical protein